MPELLSTQHWLMQGPIIYARGGEKAELNSSDTLKIDRLHDDVSEKAFELCTPLLVKEQHTILRSNLRIGRFSYMTVACSFLTLLPDSGKVLHYGANTGEVQGLNAIHILRNLFTCMQRS